MISFSFKDGIGSGGRFGEFATVEEEFEGYGILTGPGGGVQVQGIKGVTDFA